MFCFKSILQIWIIVIRFRDTNDFVNLGICKHEFKFTCRGYCRFTLMRYSTLKSFSFMFCQRFDWNFKHVSCHSYFLIGNVIQNVNSGEFSNVNNEFNVRNARNWKFSFIFSSYLIFVAFHRPLTIFPGTLVRVMTHSFETIFCCTPCAKADDYLASTAHPHLYWRCAWFALHILVYTARSLYKMTVHFWNTPNLISV